MHEASLSDFNSFVTLTYDDEHVPLDGSLRYRDFQLFLKRLRKKFCGHHVRFFMCGEYGEHTFRPHFHALLFGVAFGDRELFSMRREPLFTSPVLSALWPHGFSSVGEVTFESAAYVARYVTKKVTGEAAVEHYRRVSPDGEVYWLRPEFCQMSRRPGIGAPWLRKFFSDVYPRDYVVVRGRETRPPRFYDRLLEARNAGLAEDIGFSRSARAEACASEYTPERLRVREVVARARLSQSKRVL